MGTEFFWFYDVILAAVLIGSLFLGVKRGFVRMVLSFASLVIAFALSLVISGWASTWVYENFVEQALETSISDAINDALGESVVTQIGKVDMSQATVGGKKIDELDITPDSAGKIAIDLNDVNLDGTGIENVDLTLFGFDKGTDIKSLDIGKIEILESDIKGKSLDDILLAEVLSDNILKADVFDNITDIINNINEALPVLGLSEDMLSQIDNTLLRDVLLSVIESGGNPGEAVLDNVIKPIVLVPIRTLIFIVLFIVIMIILSVIIKASSLVNKLPLIGKFNEVLGGVLGIVQGLLVVFVIVILFHLLVSVTDNSLIFLNDMTINRSYAFSWVYNFSFLDFLA